MNIAQQRYNRFNRTLTTVIEIMPDKGTLTLDLIEVREWLEQEATLVESIQDFLQKDL